MGLDRLNNLARLSVASDIEKQVDFDAVIRSLAKKRCARQPCFNRISVFNRFSTIYIFYVDCCFHETVSIQVMNDLSIFKMNNDVNMH